MYNRGLRRRIVLVWASLRLKLVSRLHLRQLNETNSMSSTTKIRRILIVGGGVAGLTLATRLGNRLGRAGRADITLVDRSPTHIWKPMLHALAAGTWDAQQQQVSFLAHAREHHFNYHPGEICHIDRIARNVRLAPIKLPGGEVVVQERKLDYDALVLAIGSRANDFGTPGVAEHCHFIDSQFQADAFNQTLRARILRCVAANETLRVAIVGGGATGVELCAELSRLLELAANYGDRHIRQRLHLTLLESAPRILAAFPERISASSAEQLRRIGVEIHVDTRVVGAEPDGFRLSDGRLVPASLMVWAAGVKAADFLAKLPGLEITRSNQLVVRPTLQTLGDPNIFALGDCASLMAERGSKPLPPTAQVANQQAEHLAYSLVRWLDGAELQPFAFRDMGSLVSLSDYNAFGTLGKFGFFKGGFLKGRFAQAGHALLYRRQQIALHGVSRAAVMWLAEALNRLVRPPIRMS